MLANEIAGKLIIAAVADDKLNVISLRQKVEIAHTEAAALAGTGTLYVYNLVHSSRHAIQRPLTAGLDHQFISRSEQPPMSGTSSRPCSRGSPPVNSTSFTGASFSISATTSSSESL